jgi:hypothetical protein
MSSTSSGYSISQQTDTNITSPSNNQVIKYNSTSSKWENSNLSNILRISNVVFINYNFFTQIDGNSYQFANNYDTIVLDTYNTPSIKSLILAGGVSGNGLYTYRVQMLGNLSMMYRFVSNNMYTASSAWISNDSIPDDNSTYLITYYQTANNPYVSAVYPSWYIVKQGSNTIPMKDADIYLLATNNYHSIVANMVIQQVPIGQNIRFYDIGNNLSTTTISVTSYDGSTIDGASTKPYTTNSLNKQLLYISGNFIAL